MRQWPKILGLVLGLLVAALVVDRAGRHRLAINPPSGEAVGDIGGALRRLAIQFVHGADFAIPVYRDFLPALSDEVVVYVLCPDQASYDELLGQLPTLRCRLVPVLTGHAMTTWSRDRWVALQGQPITLVCPRREAGADAWPERAGDELVAFDLKNAMGMAGRAQRSELYFDGGDFLVDERCVFVTPAVLRRNLQHTVQSESELIDRLTANLKRRIILLREAPEHHAAMFMMAVGDQTMLVADPSLARK